LKPLLRISSLLFAVFMLLISTGASVSIHYCNGNIIDFAIDKRAEACDGYYESKANSPVGCSITRKGCCEDDDRLLLAENDYPPTPTSKVQDTPALYLFSFTELPTFTKNPRVEIDCLTHSPPIIKTEYQVLFQVFVI